MATKTSKKQGTRPASITEAHKITQERARIRKAMRREGKAAAIRQAKRAAKKITQKPPIETLAQ
jgi:hypothetical protein